MADAPANYHAPTLHYRARESVPTAFIVELEGTL